MVRMAELRRWWRAVGRVQARSSRNRSPLLAAGVAFYALLALVPGLVALLSLYGLIFDPADVQRQMANAFDGAPFEVRNFLATQMADIANRDSGTALVNIAVGILVALFSASGGMGHLLGAIDATRGSLDRRNFVRKRGTAIIVTVAGTGMALVALALLTFVPELLSSLDVGGELVIRLLSWVLLLVTLTIGLGLLYRVGPSVHRTPWFHLSPGVVVAMLLWTFGSVGFSIYTSNFSSYNETYGSIGAVVVLMLWLFISAYAIILGAEVNADAQRRADVESSSSEHGELLFDTEDEGEGISGLLHPVDDRPEQPSVGS